MISNIFACFSDVSFFGPVFGIAFKNRTVWQHCTPQVTHMHRRSTMKAMEKYDVVAEASPHFKFRLQCGRHRMIYLQDTSDAERKQVVR